MWIVFGNGKKPDEPARYFLHAHMKGDSRCYWMHVDKESIGLNRNALFADAVRHEQLGGYLDLIQKKYGDQLEELTAMPCVMFNTYLSPQQQKLLRITV